MPGDKEAMTIFILRAAFSGAFRNDSTKNWVMLHFAFGIGGGLLA